MNAPATSGSIGAGFGAGFVLGPLAGGLLAEWGPRAPFWAAAALAAGNVAFGWFVLKETLDPARARAFDWRRANPVGTLRQLGKLPGVRRLLFVYFLYYVAFAVYPSVWAYFGQARFGWSPSLIGMSLGLFGVAMVLVQAFAIQFALNRFGEQRTVVIGHLFAVGTYCGIALISSGPVALLLTPIAALAGIIPPALQGIMSRRVADNAQGELQGALSSASSLAMVLSPLAMTASFAAFTRPEAAVYLPGAPFLLAASLMVVAMVMFIFRSPLSDVTSQAT